MGRASTTDLGTYLGSESNSEQSLTVFGAFDTLATGRFDRGDHARLAQIKCRGTFHRLRWRYDVTSKCGSRPIISTVLTNLAACFPFSTIARRRAVGLFATTSIHIVALTALSFADSGGPVARPASITAFDVSPPGAALPNEPELEQPIEVPPQPIQPLVLPPAFIPSQNEVVTALLHQAAAFPVGGACDLTEPVQAALRLNPLIEEELGTIADERLSVAKALAIWQEVWTDADNQLPEPALAVIRETVRQTILAASDDCRFQIQVGPRLIYLPQTNETITLALGSGEWTWQQVADTADPELMFPGDSVAPQEWKPFKADPKLTRAAFDGSDGSKTKARPIAERPRLTPQQERTGR